MNPQPPAIDKALVAKLLRVAQAINYIEKSGRNDHHKYNFVQAVDVVKQIRDLLFAEGVFMIPSAGNARHHEYTASRGGTAFLTTVDLAYRFIDTDSGAEIVVPWSGVGADTGGDKGVYKAYTGGLKYALLNLFLIPTSDDPERDQLTEQGGQDKAHKDDERPVAPRIPVDRAGNILKLALAVDMAKLPGEDKPGEPPVYLPVFQALLAQQGVEKIGALNVDQAEAVEAFLATEAQGDGR